MLIWLFQWLDCSVWSLHVQAGSCVLVVCPHNSLSTSFCCNKIFLILYFLIVSPGISQCCKEPWFLLVKNDIVVKNPPASAGGTGDMGSIPGVGNGNPFQYICLENSVDREASRAAVHGVAESRTQLSDWVCRCAHTQEVCSVLLGYHCFCKLSASSVRWCVYNFVSVKK